MALMHVGEVTALGQESVTYASLGWVSAFNLWKFLGENKREEISLHEKVYCIYYYFALPN